MTDYVLKSKLDNMFKLMDDIQYSNPELTKATGMTPREMLKYNLLQLDSYLNQMEQMVVWNWISLEIISVL